MLAYLNLSNQVTSELNSLIENLITVDNNKYSLTTTIDNTIIKDKKYNLITFLILGSLLTTEPPAIDKTCFLVQLTNAIWGIPAFEKTDDIDTIKIIIKPLERYIEITTFTNDGENVLVNMELTLLNVFQFYYALKAFTRKKFEVYYFGNYEIIATNSQCKIKELQ